MVWLHCAARVVRDSAQCAHEYDYVDLCFSVCVCLCACIYELMCYTQGWAVCYNYENEYNSLSLRAFTTHKTYFRISKICTCKNEISERSVCDVAMLPCFHLFDSSCNIRSSPPPLDLSEISANMLPRNVGERRFRVSSVVSMCVELPLNYHTALRHERELECTMIVDRVCVYGTR